MRWRPQGLKVKITTAVLLPFLTAFAVYAVWLYHTRPLMTGDEPCYFAQAQSLAHDLDLDLKDDLTESGGVIDMAPDITDGRGCAEDFRDNGTLRAWFNPGVPVLLAPFLRISFKVMTARIVMIWVASLFAFQLYGLLKDVRSRARLGVPFVWIGSVLFLPVIGFSNQLYPEIPAALLVTVSGRYLLRAGRGRPWILGSSAAAACLPWLHYRFAVIAAALTLLTTLCQLPEDLPFTQRIRQVIRLRWWVPLPIGGSLLLLSLFYFHLYGSPLPWAPYSGSGASLVRLTPLQSYRVGVGTLFRATAGIVPFNPFLWVGFIGLIPFARRFKAAGLYLVALVMVQLFIVNPLGFFGYSLPGRFAIVLLPILAVSALVAIEASFVMGALASTLALLAFIPLQDGFGDYEKLYDRGRLRTGWQKATVSLWPSTENLPGMTGFSYTADDLLGLVGKLTRDAHDNSEVTVQPEDGPGIVAQTPEVELRRGSYVISVDLVGKGPPDSEAGFMMVQRTDQSGVPISYRRFAYDEIAPPPSGGKATLSVPVLVPDQTVNAIPLLVVKVHVIGSGEISVAEIRADPMGRLDPADTSVKQGMPLGTLWLILTITVGMQVAYGQRNHAIKGLRQEGRETDRP